METIVFNSVGCLCPDRVFKMAENKFMKSMVESNASLLTSAVKNVSLKQAVLNEDSLRIILY